MKDKKENLYIEMALINSNSEYKHEWDKEDPLVSIEINKSDYIYLKELSDKTGATINSLVKQFVRRFKQEFEI